MNKVQEIEGEVVRLSAQELTEFRDWFTRFDAEVWDRQFEAEVRQAGSACGAGAARPYVGKSTKV